MTTREAEIVAAFTGLADHLVQDYDVVEVCTELAQHCARLLDVAAVGLLLADGAGLLHVLAATSQEARMLEAFQLQREEGPCLDCYRSGVAVSVADLRTETARWPRFAAAAAEQGFVSVHAIPMRVRSLALGGLGLFGTQPGALGEDDLQLAQGLAHVASIAIVQNDANPDQAAVLAALQSAVVSRSIVEMAKGVLSEVHSVGMQQAYDQLRRYSHDNRRRLTDVARDVAFRRLDAEQLPPVPDPRSV